MPGEMHAASSSSVDSSELVDAAEQLMSVSKYLASRTRLSQRHGQCQRRMVQIQVYI
jgi:hypothetical protein